MDRQSPTTNYELEIDSFKLQIKFMVSDRKGERKRDGICNSLLSYSLQVKKPISRHQLFFFFFFYTVSFGSFRVPQLLQKSLSHCLLQRLHLEHKALSLFLCSIYLSSVPCFVSLQAHRVTRRRILFLFSLCSVSGKVKQLK